MAIDFEKIWKIIKDKKNVVGYSRSPRKRVKNGKIIENIRVIRVYVSKKEPLSLLDSEDVIPETIDGIEIDIIEIGEIKAQKKELEN